MICDSALGLRQGLRLIRGMRRALTRKSRTRSRGDLGTPGAEQTDTVGTSLRYRRHHQATRRSAAVYAFGEIDETGKAKLAAFAADHGGLQFEYMPIEGRLYFMRKAAG
jgi:hypothetical protein